MKLSVQYPQYTGYGIVPADQVRPGEETQKKDYPLMSEHVLEVYLNGILTFQLVCSPFQLEYLVLGRLMTEGYIDSADGIDSLEIAEQGCRANVMLRNAPENDAGAPVELIPTTGGHALPQDDRSKMPLRPLQPIVWEPDWVFRLTNTMKNGMPVHSQTHSAHCAILMRGGEILVSCEDIGRHNALDKAIGWALGNNVPLRECILFTSGRVPLDMAAKAVRAGVPVLVSKAMPTEQSVALARTYGLTLICGTYPDEYKVFCAPR